MQIDFSEIVHELLYFCFPVGIHIVHAGVD